MPAKTAKPSVATAKSKRTTPIKKMEAVTICLRLPKELLDRCDEAARKQYLDRTSFIKTCLAKCLNSD